MAKQLAGPPQDGINGRFARLPAQRCRQLRTELPPTFGQLPAIGQALLALQRGDVAL